MNDCLRPACLSDVADYCQDYDWECWYPKWYRGPRLLTECSGEERDAMFGASNVGDALVRLYNAEWRKRGFEGSP